MLPTLGGQAGLNLAMELEEAGFLKEHNVRLIGTTAETIKKAEDRLEFKEHHGENRGAGGTFPGSRRRGGRYRICQ